jgi:hypothetical protein
MNRMNQTTMTIGEPLMAFDSGIAIVNSYCIDSPALNASRTAAGCNGCCCGMELAATVAAPAKIVATFILMQQPNELIEQRSL